jgi:hypothetical protein
MISVRRAAIVAASLAFAFATPLAAQSNPFVQGEYVDVSSITIDDGHFSDYAGFLATMWRNEQEFAKSQGWITGYEVLANVHKRKGEPDLILVLRYSSIPDGAEGERRNKLFLDHAKATDAQMEAASGERAKYRHVDGSQLWQVLNFKK